MAVKYTNNILGSLTCFPLDFYDNFIDSNTFTLLLSTVFDLNVLIQVLLNVQYRLYSMYSEFYIRVLSVVYRNYQLKIDRNKSICELY